MSVCVYGEFLLNGWFLSDSQAYSRTVAPYNLCVTSDCNHGIENKKSVLRLQALCVTIVYICAGVYTLEKSPWSSRKDNKRKPRSLKGKEIYGLRENLLPINFAVNVYTMKSFQSCVYKGGGIIAVRKSRACCKMCLSCPECPIIRLFARPLQLRGLIVWAEHDVAVFQQTTVEVQQERSWCSKFQFCT